MPGTFRYQAGGDYTGSGTGDLQNSTGTLLENEPNTPMFGVLNIVDFNSQNQPHYTYFFSTFFPLTGAPGNIPVSYATDGFLFDLSGWNIQARFDGGAQGDVLNGGNLSDILSGMGGNDTLSGGIGHDSLSGGDGNDSIVGGIGFDTISGGDGNDIIIGGAGLDSMSGGSGNNTFRGTRDEFDGDIITDIKVGDQIIVDSAPLLTASISNGILTLNSNSVPGAAQVNLNGFAGGVIVTGNVITFTAPPPLPSQPPPDPSDLIYGTAGNDVIAGFDGNDTVVAGDGDDVIYGNQDNDLIEAEKGNDLVFGGKGDDTINGREGNDIIFGNDGRDVATGGEGNDALVGGAGNDILYGNQGNDVIYGNEDDDIAFGGQGNDVLFGGQGNDTLWGNDGNDLLAGNEGADRFVFGSNSGADIIAGFSFAEGDRIDLQGQTFTQGVASDGSVVLTLSGGGTILLAGVTTFQAGFLA